MRAIALGYFSIALALSLSGCVTFSNGVVDQPLANDERLIGAWEAGDEHSTVSMVIAADTPTSLSVTLSDAPACKKGDSFIAVRTQIGNHDFLDLVTAEERKPSPIAYEFNAPDRLAIFLADDEAFIKAVEDKELIGKLYVPQQSNQAPSAEVDASTEDLRQWITAHPSAMHAKPLKFTRLAAPLCR